MKQKSQMKAGDGGNGCLAFRREKPCRAAGPKRRRYGRGQGDVTMVLPTIHRKHAATLLRFDPEYRGEKRPAMARAVIARTMKARASRIQVPVGTVVFDAETGEQVFDFTEDESAAADAAAPAAADATRFTSSMHQVLQPNMKTASLERIQNAAPRTGSCWPM